MTSRRHFLPLLGTIAAGSAILALDAGPSRAANTDVVTQQIAEERAALSRARRAAQDSTARATQMEARASTLRSAAERDRAQRAALGLRIQAAEADLAEVRTRSAIIAGQQRRQRARLAAQQRPVVELLASLQLLSRRPPVSLFFQPGAARDIVHTRAMIEAVLPVVRQRTAALRIEIDRSRQLAAAQERLAEEASASATRLAARRTDLARSEAASRAQATTLASGAGLENDRAMALGEDAGDIGSLLGQLEDAGARRDRLARLAGPVPRPGSVSGDAPRTGLFGLGTPAQPAYRLPVIGRVVQGFGEVSSEGTRSRGLLIASSPGAQIVAPARGRIVYAGPFRTYGRIVIVDHGGGWTSLVTDLLTVSTRVGDEVEQGSPIGRAGTDRPRIGIELRRAGQPIDVAALAL